MSLSSQNLDAFLASARAGHFTRAAEALHITQSALSQRILNLEQELATQLFVRSRSGVRLTPAGSELLRYCLSKEALEHEVLGRLSMQRGTDLAGDLRIGGFSSIMRSLVLPALAPMVAAHPRLRLALLTKEMDELPELLHRGEIDYLIHYREIVHDHVEILRLGEEINVLVEAKTYRGGDVFLDHDEKDQTSARYLKMLGVKQAYTRRYLDDVYGLIDGVKLGLGRAVVPLHLVKGDPDLKIVNPKRHVTFPVNLHFYRRAFPSRLHDQVIQALEAAIPQRLDRKKTDLR